MEPAPYPWQEQQWRRILQQRRDNRLAHAYLLCGERGLGKLALARQAAALFLCETPLENCACGSCRSCQLLLSGTNPDLFEIGPEDSKVVKIDQIRALNEFATKTSHSGGRKVIILRQAEALNVNAANALLKTLEEPPGDTVLMLLSDNPGKLLPTLRSRCQRILFSVPSREVAKAWLEPQIEEPASADELLSLVDNRPLLALALWHSDERQVRETVLQAFVAMLTGRADPVEFAASGRNIGADRVLEWLWQLSVNLIKHQLLQHRVPAADARVAQIQHILQAGSREQDEILTRLLAINRAVEEARLHVSSPANPNPQLVLESILWRWSRLAA